MVMEKPMPPRWKAPKAPLIALYSPRAQSGKSTVADILAGTYGYRCVKFAGPLKDMVRGLLKSMELRDDTVERMVEGDLKESVVPGFRTVTPRHLMQTLGTDWGREAVDADLWTKVAMHKADVLRDMGLPVVIDDMRFPNEFKAVTEAGGVTVKIIRDESPVVGASRYEGLLDKHPFTWTIRNNGSMAELGCYVGVIVAAFTE